MHIVPTATAILFAAMVCASAAAQQIKVTLDPAQSKINIAVHDLHGGLHGTFALKSGVVLFDEKTGSASGEMIVDAGSGQTGNSTRDNKMRTEVLESKRYPEITFTPRHVTGTVASQGNSNIQVEGAFHIHGADHDLTLALPIHISGDQVTASTTFDVPYESWGMKNPSVLFLRVDGKAAVTITAVGRIAIVSPQQ